MEVRADREIVISRSFAAPAAIVFAAWTRAEHVARWWAPKSRGVTVVECSAEVRTGGRYRYVLRKGSGPDIAFSGVYKEVSPPARLVYTNVYEAMAHLGESVITVTFTEQNGHTELVAHEVYPSAAARDAALASGMEHGMREAMDQLDALVASLKGV
jgi:uncharacterized protein YndB with AHSA1/START domain